MAAPFGISEIDRIPDPGASLQHVFECNVDWGFLKRKIADINAAERVIDACRRQLTDTTVGRASPRRQLGRPTTIFQQASRLSGRGARAKDAEEESSHPPTIITVASPVVSATSSRVSHLAATSLISDAASPTCSSPTPLVSSGVSTNDPSDQTKPNTFGYSPLALWARRGQPELVRQVEQQLGPNQLRPAFQSPPSPSAATGRTHNLDRRKRIGQRTRIAKACLTCKKRKVKCDLRRPCEGKIDLFSHYRMPVRLRPTECSLYEVWWCFVVQVPTTNAAAAILSKPPNRF